MTALATKTANEYLAEARRSLQEREDSFERSDTDGFLTQWSAGLNAELCRTRAKIMQNDGDDVFVGLWDGNRRVRAKIINTKFGMSWLLNDIEAQTYGRKFLPVGKTSRVLKQLGLREANEMAPAWAKLEGRGRGLSGMAWVQTYRTGDPWGSDATLCE